MAAREFGFICGDFTVAMSNDGYVMPGSDNLYFAKSLVEGAQAGEVSGRYLLRVYHRGSVVCRAKVEVGWGGHRTQGEALLGLKSDAAPALLAELRKFSGKEVELQFTPIRSFSD
jgi:hypothetical protein